MNVVKEQGLRDIYYDPVAGYQSRESRYAFAIPVYRKDTKNMVDAVGELL